MLHNYQRIIIFALILIVFAMGAAPVSAGLIIPADPGYSGIPSFGNSFHFTPFTSSSELSQSYVFSGDAISSYSNDLATGSVAMMYGYALPGTEPKAGSLFSQAMMNYYTNQPLPIANPSPSDFTVPGMSNADTYYYYIPGGCNS
jgi:hypothetical protein